MPIAELVLDTSPSDVESFYFKATDSHTSLVVLAASKDQFRRLIDSAQGAPGIYILQAEDTTAYVGKSVDLAGRLRSHKTSDKIAYRRVLVMLRDQNISRYLDYCEAKLYDTLRVLGYRLEQAPLSGSLDNKRQRLAQMDKEHVNIADGLVTQFLGYSVALGLVKPHHAAFPASPSAPSDTAPAQKEGPATPLGTPPIAPPATELLGADAPLTPEVTTTRKKAPPSPALSVRLSDGSLISENSSTATFIKALSIAGLSRLADLGLVLSGDPLVSAVQSSRYPSASKAIDGFWVMTHSDTGTKKKLLQKVSLALGLGWTVT